MKHRYNYQRKHDLWRKDRYTSRARDLGLVIAMLVVGGGILAVLAFLLFKP